MGSTYPFDGQGRQKALQAIEILEGRGPGAGEIGGPSGGRWPMGNSPAAGA